MSAELQAHGKLMGGVRAATRTQKLKVPKSVQKRIDKAEKNRKNQKGKDDTPKEGKRPRANDVQEALKKGKIKPAEAADLNPLGGLTPGVKDVRDAVKGGHISPEEGYGLNPQSVRSPKKVKEEEPTFVTSERTNAPSEHAGPRPIEAPRQWKANGY